MRFIAIALLLFLSCDLSAHITPKEECQTNIENELKFFFSSPALDRRFKKHRLGEESQLLESIYSIDKGQPLLKEEVLFKPFPARLYKSQFYRYYFEASENPFCGKLLKVVSFLNIRRDREAGWFYGYVRKVNGEGFESISYQSFLSD